MFKRAGRFIAIKAAAYVRTKSPKGELPAYNVAILQRICTRSGREIRCTVVRERTIHRIHPAGLLRVVEFAKAFAVARVLKLSAIAVYGIHNVLRRVYLLVRVAAVGYGCKIESAFYARTRPKCICHAIVIKQAGYYLCNAVILAQLYLHRLNHVSLPKREFLYGYRHMAYGLQLAELRIQRHAAAGHCEFPAAARVLAQCNAFAVWPYCADCAFYVFITVKRLGAYKHHFARPCAIL